MKLENQVAIITGAGRNIGERIAHVLSGEGARIAVVDLDKGRGDAVAAEINAAGGDAAAYVADVSRSDDVAKLVADVVGRFGRVDILVNNVAISDNRDILEITEEEWDNTIAVTLKAPFLMVKHVVPHMIEQGDGGKIVNIGSTSGHRGRARAVAYASAKGGVANFTRSIAFQLAPYGIRVNTVSPNKTAFALAVIDLGSKTLTSVDLEGSPAVDELNGMSWDPDSARVIGLMQNMGAKGTSDTGARSGNGHGVNLMSLDPTTAKWTVRAVVVTSWLRSLLALAHGLTGRCVAVECERAGSSTDQHGPAELGHRRQRRGRT